MLTQVGRGLATGVGGGWERHHGNGLLSPLQRLSLDISVKTSQIRECNGDKKVIDPCKCLP